MADEDDTRGGARALVFDLFVWEGCQQHVEAVDDRPGQRAPDPDLGREERNSADTSRPEPAGEQHVEYIVPDEHRHVGSTMADQSADSGVRAHESRCGRKGFAEAGRSEMTGLELEERAGVRHPRATKSGHDRVRALGADGTNQQRPGDVA